MKIQFEHNGIPVNLNVERVGEQLTVTLPSGRLVTVHPLDPDIGHVTLEIPAERRTIAGTAASVGRTVEISYKGETYRFEPVRQASARAAGLSGEVRAPMVGVVSAVLVSVGDSVSAWQPLATMEAMKVVATLEAPFAGTVSRVNAKPGDRVEHGAVLVEIVKG